MTNAKLGIIDVLTRLRIGLSPELRPFRPLFQRWFLIARDAQLTLDDLIARATIEAVPTIDLDTLLLDEDKSVHLIQRVEELCLGYYRQYLTTGTDFLQGRGVYGDSGKA